MRKEKKRKEEKEDGLGDTLAWVLLLAAACAMRLLRLFFAPGFARCKGVETQKHVHRICQHLLLL